MVKAYYEIEHGQYEQGKGTNETWQAKWGGYGRAGKRREHGRGSNWHYKHLKIHLIFGDRVSSLNLELTN